jgi:ABC-2 type transport system permease protein
MAMAMSADPAAFPAESARYGEVYDRGYAHYTGERLGRKHAFWALIRYSIQRALGIKKRWTAKIVPIIIYLVSAGAVLIMIGIEAFIESADTMDYAEFIVYIFAVLGLFVATSAPEMICPDRRENVLALYFARAITRLDYVLAKLGAISLLTLSVSVLPAVLLWLFRQLLADSPLSALKDNAGQLGKIIVAGTLIALILGAVGLVVSSFTGRKAIAIALIIVGYGVLETFVGLFYEALDDRSWSDYLYLVSPFQVSEGLAFSLLSTPEEHPDIRVPFEWWAYSGVIAATVLLCCAIMVWRYVPED